MKAHFYQGQYQCDHMVKLFVQYLAIYNNENLHQSIIFYPSRFNTLQIQTNPCKKLPKRWNFSKSDYSGVEYSYALQVFHLNQLQQRQF